jgi:hypothetical protein
MLTTLKQFSLQDHVFISCDMKMCIFNGEMKVDYLNPSDHFARELCLYLDGNINMCLDNE